MLEGRWKLALLFHLFGGQVLRFSGLERCVTGISQKMLAQQVPPKVDYRMTAWGQELCPALDAILTWAELRETHVA
tara:strand:+ start:182 stop:409 length:228 start_codon:yes stop_codon:yes gene_type:complete